jgi:ankyrin repeat protein
MPSSKQDLLQRVLDAALVVRQWTKNPVMDNPSFEFDEALTAYLNAVPDEDFLALVTQHKIPTASRTTFGSLISLVAQNGRTSLIEPLVAAGCDLNTKDFDDIEPLAKVMANTSGPEGAAAVVAMLEAGACLSSKRKPLASAAALGKCEVVEALLQRGHLPSEPCDSVGMPLSVASRALASPDCARTVRALLEAGAVCGRMTSTTKDTTAAEKAQAATQALFELCHEGEPLSENPEQARAVLDVLVEFGADLNATDEVGDPLTICIGTSQDDFALALLQRGANPTLSARSEIDDWTLFQRAAIEGAPKSVAFMMQRYGESADQELTDGQRLIDVVTDSETMALLLATTSHDIIGGVVGGDDGQTPVRARTHCAPSL